MLEVQKYRVGFLTAYFGRLGEAESSLLKSEKVLQQYQSRFDVQEEEQSLALQTAWARGRCYIAHGMQMQTYLELIGMDRDMFVTHIGLL